MGRWVMCVMQREFTPCKTMGVRVCKYLSLVRAIISVLLPVMGLIMRYVVLIVKAISSVAICNSYSVSSKNYHRVFGKTSKCELSMLLIIGR